MPVAASFSSNCLLMSNKDVTMQLLTIDEHKCNKDSLCILECPFNLLAEDEDGVPVMIAGGEENCLRCGHCLAVCPTGAITLENIAPTTCEIAENPEHIGIDAMERLLKNRRSVRMYKNKPIPRAEVGRLMDMVRWAPTAKNLQPVHWTLVDTRETITKMAGMTVDWLRNNQLYPEIVTAWQERGEDMILRSAPLLVICHAHKEALNPPVDCAIAATSLELAASAMGIGGCWAGFFMRAANMHAPLANFLDLPDNHSVHAALMLGYPKFTYQRVPARQAEKTRWLD